MPFHPNHLHYYLDLIRDEPCRGSGYSLFNILNTWKTSRDNRILNEDFYHIDFGYIPLNNIIFGDGEYSSSFNGATLNEENFASGHVGAIICSAISPDCKYILTGSEDKTAILWEIATGFVHAKIEMNDRVDFVSFSDDSKECFIGAYREPPIVWSIEKASIVYRFQELIKNTVLFKPSFISFIFGLFLSVVYSNNKRYCVVYGVHKFGNWFKGSESDTIIVMDMHKRTYTELYSDVNIGKITACSNDGRYVLTVKTVEKEILEKSDTDNYKTYKYVSEVWDMEEGKMVFRSPIYEQIQYAAFSNDSRYVVLYEHFSGTSYNHIVGIFDLKSGKELSKLTIETERNFDTYVYRLTFSSDGSFVLFSQYGYVDSILETDSWRRIAILGDIGRKYRLAVFSPDNRFCVVTITEGNESNDCIYVFDVLSDRFIKSLVGHSNRVTSLSFSDDSRLLVSTDSNNKCILWNTSEWNEICAFGGSRIKNQYCVFLPKGELHELFDFGEKHQVIAAVSSKSIQLWDAETRGKIGFAPLFIVMHQFFCADYPIDIEEFSISSNKRFIHIIARPLKSERNTRDLISFDMKSPNTYLFDKYCRNTPYAFSDDHSILATYTSKSRHGDYLTLIDLKSDNLIYQAEREYFSERNSRFKRVLFSSHNSFCFFDFGDNYSIFSLSDKTFKDLDVGFSVGTSVFSSDERFLLLGGYRSGSAVLFNTDGNRLHEFHITQHIESIDFSPDSKYCMIQSPLLVRIFDVENGELVRTYTTILCIVNAISGARFILNNECLVYLSDGSVISWNFITGKKTKIAPKNKNDCPDYSDDLKYGISIIDDKNDRIRLYDMSTRTYTDLYNIDGVNVRKCDFTDVNASEILKKILYQNHANIEPPTEESF